MGITIEVKDPVIESIWNLGKDGAEFTVEDLKRNCGDIPSSTLYHRLKQYTTQQVVYVSEQKKSKKSYNKYKLDKEKFEDIIGKVH